MTEGESNLTLVRGVVGSGKTTFVSNLAKFIVEGKYLTSSLKIVICS